MSFNLAFAIARKRTEFLSDRSKQSLTCLLRPDGWFFAIVLIATALLVAPAAYAQVPPVANSQIVNINEDATNVSITLTATDDDGDLITYNAPNTAGLTGSLTGTAPGLIYNPPANYNGSTSFSFNVTANGETSADATVTINVAPQPDPPTSTPIGNQTGTEGVPFSLNVSGNFSDPDGDTLTYSATGLPASLSPINSNTAVINGTPTQAEAQFNGGVYNVNVTATDPTSNSTSRSFTLTIDAVNEAPVANPQSVSTNEDTDRPITLTATDGDGDTLTWAIVSGPGNGTLIGSPPSLTYRPDPNFNGNDSFRYRVNDGTVDSNIATISITVNPQNDTPTTTGIGNQSASEGSLFDINVSGSFDDVDGDTLTYSASGLPASLTITASGGNRGRIAGTPTQAEAEFNGGVYNVTVTATDPSAASVSAGFTLTIGAVNEAPVANPQNVSANEDTDLPITLTATDGDGDTLTWAIVSGPGNGTLIGSPPSVTYRPDANFDGNDSFRFRVNDGTVDSNIATISITVNPQNDTPTTTGIGNQSASEGSLFDINVSGSFDDVDGDTLTYSASGLPASLTITASGGNRGRIAGTPTQAEAEFNGGVYNVTVTATDPSAASVSAGFTLTIGAVNEAPVANPQSVSTNEDTDRSITLTATDGDGDTLTFAIVSGPNNGTILGTTPTVTYRPNANYNGPDSFTFKANDGTVDSNTATISITVNPQNDPPTSTPIGNQSASEGLPFSLNVSGNFDDVDGDDLTYSATGLPASLTPIDSGSGLISGTPTLAEAQANGGIYNVTVTATDPSNSSVATSFVLTIGIVNDAPVANAQNLEMDEDNSLPIVLTGFDADGDTLTYTVIGSPTNGALVGEPPNLTYTPNLNFNGADSFSFTVNDGTVSSAPALISITVNPVNDLPILVLPIDDQQAVEAAPFSLDVSGNFDDVDGGGLTFSAIGLPASLGPIDPVTGVIDGTPTQAEAQANDGIYIVTVTATDGAAESVTDTFQLLVVELGRANVALSVSAAPTPAMLNDQIQFSFVVSNNGPAPATDIELNGSFIGNGLVVAPSGATTCTLEAAVNQVTNFNCLIGMLNLSASTSLTISVSTANPGAVTLAATAAVSTPLPIDPDLQDNSAQTTVGVAEFFSNGAVQILGNSQILSVAHGDVNGDGATDIVLGTVAGIPAQVYLSSGFREFSVAAISVPDSSAQQGVALADFDNNGTLDIVLANAGVPDAVYGNDGSGNFTLMATLPGDTFSNDIAAALLNNDNNMDIVVARTGGNMVYLGDGSGGFAASGAPLGIADSRAVAVGRVNNNARPDVVFANVGSPSTLWNDVGVSANNAPSDTFDIGDASSVVIAELLGGTNADALDIAFGRIPTIVGDIPENVLIINNGSGGAAGMIRIGAAPTNDILAGDVNRDGLNDLVFVNATGVHQIWTRSGDSFTLHPEQIVADDAVSGVIADLGDTDVDEPGGVDLAMGGFPTTGAGVYLNDGTGNLGKGDITPPVLVLNGANPMEITSGSAFIDPRATATDNINGDISASVIATGTVNTAVVGSYTVTYNVSDFAGNPAAPITRTVTVIPGTGTGGGGGGSISPFAIAFLLTLLMVSYAMRRVYIAQVTNNKNQ